MHTRIHAVAATVLGLCLGLASHAPPAMAQPPSVSKPSRALEGGGPALHLSHYDTTVISFDGTPIAITVFVPEAPANTPVPLVVHSHGWGTHRMHALRPHGAFTRAFWTKSEDAARIANDNGYYVISYDERGWGQSGGTDQVMDPAYEGRDFQAVLDWAEANLGPQLARRDGKLQVGTLGYSYGGGYQLMAASIDDRVAVSVPALAWYAFPSAVGPGEPLPQPRSQWLRLLVTVGKAFGNSMYPNLMPDLWQAAKDGIAPQWIIDLGNTRGANAYCEGHPDLTMNQHIPTIPMLLVQGWQDTLMNANQAIANARCLRKAGGDVHLLIQEYGHMLPVAQPIPPGDGITGVGMQTTVHCGSYTFRLDEAMYSFIDATVRGSQHSGPHVDLPRNCLTLDDTQGIAPDTLPEPSARYTLDAQTVRDSRFIPLYTATGARSLAGIPHAQLTIASPGGADAYAYVGLAVRPAREAQAQLVDDQVLPLHGAGTYDGDLVGVSTMLHAGDVLGVLASNANPQFSYQTPQSRRPAAYTLSGSVAIPFAD